MVSPKKFLPAIFLFLSLVAFFHLFLIDWYRIPSNSMAPTLQNNCIVLTQKSNNSRVLFPKIFQFEIKKNDILIFLKPEWIQNEKDQKIYIKRCNNFRRILRDYTLNSKINRKKSLGDDIVRSHW